MSDIPSSTYLRAIADESSQGNRQGLSLIFKRSRLIRESSESGPSTPCSIYDRVFYDDYSNIKRRKRKISTSRRWPEKERGSSTKQDPIHGHVKIYYPLNLLFNTPEVQRLQTLKQIPASYEAYPAATHTRYSHALGTYNLTYTQMSHLKEKSKNIRDAEKLALCVVAICHDIGQGPLTYAFKEYYLRKTGNPYDVHRQSIRLLHRMFKRDQKLKRAFDEYLSERDYILIDEAMCPPLTQQRFELDKNGKKVWKMNGCVEEKNFLLDIVLDVDSGVDQCRMDYVMRDTIAVGNGTAFTPEAQKHLCSTSMVLPDNMLVNKVQYNEEAIQSLFDFAKAHVDLSTNSYNHRMTITRELTMIRILLNVEDCITYKNDNGEMVPLSKITEEENLSAFVITSDDSVKFQIDSGTEETLKTAKEMSTNPEYYRLVVTFRQSGECSEEGITEEIIEQSNGSLTKDAFQVYVKNTSTGVRLLKVPLYEGEGTPCGDVSREQVMKYCGSNVLENFYMAFIFVENNGNMLEPVSKACKNCICTGRSLHFYHVEWKDQNEPEPSLDTPPPSNVDAASATQASGCTSSKSQTSDDSDQDSEPESDTTNLNSSTITSRSHSVMPFHNSSDDEESEESD